MQAINRMDGERVKLVSWGLGLNPGCHMVDLNRIKLGTVCKTHEMCFVACVLGSFVIQDSCVQGSHVASC
jgi:hypothetical protein